jgi:hypothetical protein
MIAWMRRIVATLPGGRRSHSYRTDLRWINPGLSYTLIMRGAPRGVWSARKKITLADLDETLLALSEGAVHHLTTHDYKRLFGENDVALRRLRHFVDGHNCVASFSDGSILFRKLVAITPRQPH